MTGAHELSGKLNSAFFSGVNPHMHTQYTPNHDMGNFLLYTLMVIVILVNKCQSLTETLLMHTSYSVYVFNLHKLVDVFQPPNYVLIMQTSYSSNTFKGIGFLLVVTMQS